MAIGLSADAESCKNMQPEILPGDELTIDVKARRIEESKIFLVSYNEEQRFCRVLQASNGVWLIYSNPAFPPEFIPKDKINTFKIIGKVTKQTRNC